jgi:hypothetical protein
VDRGGENENKKKSGRWCKDGHRNVPPLTATGPLYAKLSCQKLVQTVE